MFVEVFLFFGVLFLYLIFKDRKPANMPNGPMEIPFLGSHFPSYNDQKLDKLREKYGDIVSLRAGDLRAVVVFDYDMAKEILGRTDFSNRPEYYKNFSTDELGVGGVASSNGPQWVHDRRFFIRNLRSLGMGKSYMEGAVHEEAEALVADLLKYEGKPINFPESFRTAPLNIIWQMIASKRFDLRSSEVKSIYDASKELFNGGSMSLIPEMFSCVNYLPDFITKPLFKTHLLQNYLKNMRGIVDKAIDEHEKDFDPDNPKDLIDEYFVEMKSGTADETMVRKGALRQIVADSFDAGSDTTNNMMKWLVRTIVKYPEITQKVRKQIDEVVPRESRVTMEDKPRLPYVEAYLAEVARVSALVVVNVERCSTKDTQVNGYLIPKGTTIVASIYSIHHDEKYWDDPRTFKPERHLDSEGKYRQPDRGFMLFGSGRRQCAGEVLARMEFFIFATTILQNLDIQVPEGEKFDDSVHCDTIGFRLPADNKLIYKKRQ